MQRSVLSSFFVAVALAVGACGGSSNGPTAPPPPQPFNLTASGVMELSHFASYAFNPPRAGTATIKLSWTGNGNMDLYLTSATCSTLPINGNCQIIKSSQTMSANPEQMTHTVAAGEQYKVWAVNRPIFIDHNSPLNFKIDMTVN